MGFLWDFYKKIYGRRKKASLSGEVARRNAGTERLQQICDNLSVSLRLTAPLEGEPKGPVLPEILRIRQRPLSQHP